MKPRKGWHFVGKTLRDGSPVPRDGVWLKHKGPLVLCSSGLHWSRDPFDALSYAPGPILCEVEVRGGWIGGGDTGELPRWVDPIYNNDKGVAPQRRILRRMDATELLRFFARHCVLSVIHLYPNGTDDDVFDYLMTGDENLRAAAWAAARAASAAAWAAAWAARDATRDAARAAAWAAARDAAWAAQREYFNQLVNECFS